MLKKIYQQAVLVAIYDISNGKAGVPVSKSKIIQYLDEHKLLSLTLGDLLRYRIKVIDRIKLGNKLSGRKTLNV